MQGIMQGIVQRTVLVISLLLVINGLWVTPAIASIHTYPEAGDRAMVRSLQTLRDEAGHAWQIVLYKRVQNNQVTTLNLRLVGFPNQSKFDHFQPLKIDVGLGEIWTAKDITPDDFGSNVGEYDFQSIMAQLDSSAPLTLQLPLTSGSTKLLVPPFTMREWQHLVSNHP
jgi:acyl-CoA synthetase (AMP-forming)/AMP-acid ligase II